MSKYLTPNRIRGCFYGALAGDCLGFPYEEFVHGPMDYTTEDVAKFVENFPQGVKKLPIQYTDDTSMMRCIAQSLIACNEFNPKDLAQKFTETYYGETKARGYGGSITQVFRRLRETNYADPFSPAKMQFNGSGSYGNGGAMRVASGVLFYANDFDKAMGIALNQCLITHTHPDGIMGSVLQAAAIYIALHSESKQLDAKSFIKQLREIMEKQEVKIYPKVEDNCYKEKIDAFEALLAEDTSTKNVVKVLGNGEAALHSVATAIFCFVRCLNPLAEIQIENPIQRTIAYAISLKGDTDTIGTMAGAIAGAYYGDSYIPKSWLDSFEGAKDYESYAEFFNGKLFGETALDST